MPFSGRRGDRELNRDKMRIYIGFDDTDEEGGEFGTGKVARRLADELPAGCRLWGVVRQQLLVHPRIPFTSHNSSACVVLDTDDPSLAPALLSRAARHIERSAVPGSDPGLCFVVADDPSLPALMSFGLLCARRIMSQAEARQAAGRAHLSGHGGTDDGIIGAAAAVGLTASGWSGRFIEFAGLRDFPDPVTVEELAAKGIRAVSLERDVFCPAPEDLVHTHKWLRPRLWGGEAVLPVLPAASGVWESMGRKRRN
ncbi:MAG: hypothetical protein QM278_02185 [Pseudomonadota bacterium]|nr:hypothetical protein [Pseudomonadota bacterium]